MFIKKLESPSSTSDGDTSFNSEEEDKLNSFEKQLLDQTQESIQRAASPLLKERIRLYLSTHIASDSDLQNASNTISKIIDFASENMELDSQEKPTLIEQDILEQISRLEEMEQSSPTEVVELIKKGNVFTNLARRVSVVFYDKMSDLWFISEKTDSGKLTAYAFKKQNLLGVGGSGAVYKVDFVGQRAIMTSVSGWVIKISMKEEYHQKSLMAEYEVLQYLHHFEGVIGVQNPIFLIETIDGKKAYIATKFEYNLLMLTPEVKGRRKIFEISNLLRQCKSLFEGVKFIHEHDVVHGDIKPENLCAERINEREVQFRTADFGTARKKNQIDLNHIMAGGTITYMCGNDMFYSLYISAEYMLSKGMSKDDVQLEIERRTKAIYNNLVKEIEDIPPLEAYLETMRNYVDELAKDPARDEETLRNEAMELLRKRDVYALAKSLQDMFDGIILPEPMNSQFNDLIKGMKDEDYTQRSGINEALDRYQRILDALS